MKVIVAYIIVTTCATWFGTNDITEALENKVMQKVLEGWEPHGGPICLEGYGIQPKCYQAMVKYEEK